MKPMYRNGLKGRQHIAQGTALGRRTIVKFALKGHKHYNTTLLPFQGEHSPIRHVPRALPWAGSFMAFQAVQRNFRNFS